MTRDRVAKLCRDELDRNGLTSWHIRFSTNPNTAYLAYCSYKDESILINSYFSDTNADEAIVDVIKHEVAHALCPGHGHDSVWAVKARELGCQNTLSCPGYSMPAEVIDAIRSGADVKIEFETETHIVHRPKYEITRLQDKCPTCGKVAKEQSSTLLQLKDGETDKKFIWLECGHLIIRDIPKATAFGSLISNFWRVSDCQHEFNLNRCTKCGESKLFPFQTDGARFLEQALAINNGGAIFDEMGLGKAQILETPILTNKGWKQNKDLRIGDLVIASDGLSYPVMGIHPRGLLDFYRIHFSDGSSTNCCDDHLWIVNTPIRKWRNQPNLVKSWKELKNDLYLTATNSSGKLNNKWYIPITAPVQFDKQDVYISPYQIGLLLGDGSLAIRNNLGFTSTDKQLVDEFNWPQVGSTITYRCNDLNFKNALDQYDLIGTDSSSKFIPPEYRFNSFENRLALLQGLMDTDGSIWNNGTVEYTTISPVLSRHVRELVQSLGGTVKTTIKEEPKYTYKGETLIGQRCYRLVINIPLCPFRLERKMLEWYKYHSIKKYNPTRAIVGYEYLGKHEGQCISVASPDHSYLTEEYIVTHNTVQALAYLKFHPETQPVLFVLKSGIKFQWFKEVLKWLGPEWLGQIIETSKDFIIPNAPCYFVSYDIFTQRLTKSGSKTGKKIEDFEHCKTLVLDECQQIKNPDSARTGQIRRLAKGKKVIALSGTPWKNRGSEFYTVLNMLAPMKFPTYQGFLDRWVDYYFDGQYTKQTGIKNIERFKEYIQDIALRREVFEVAVQMPDVNRSLHYTTLDDVAEKTYDDAESDFVKWFNEKIISGEDENVGDINILAEMARMRHITGLAKIPATLEFVEEFYEETDRKLVIFVHHKDVGEILTKELKDRFKDVPIYKLTAELDGQQRFEVAESFQSAKRAFMVASTLASGEGINLQTCGDAILHERQWNPQNEDQAAPGRFRRIGASHNSVNVTFMTAAGTIDEILADIVERKRGYFHNAMNKGEEVVISGKSIAQELAEGLVANQKNKLQKLASLPSKKKVK